MLQVIWILGDVEKEIKVYESLALQYFYSQDIVSCKKFQDRALRGKLESNQSLAKLVSLKEGSNKNKKTLFALARVERTNKTKLSDSVLSSYSPILQLINRIKNGNEFRSNVEQMVAEVIDPVICNRKIRAQTPLMKLPSERFVSPSDNNNDHMLLPSLTARE